MNIVRHLSKALASTFFVLAALGCGTSRAAVPTASDPLPRFSFAGLAGAPVAVRVVDHRADPERSEEWIARVRSDVEAALRTAGIAIASSSDDIVEVRINNARADFELGNWNGCAKLAGDVVRAGQLISAVGERCVKKGNLWGYKTADNVTTMAYRDALAELLSNLDAQMR